MFIVFALIGTLFAAPVAFKKEVRLTFDMVHLDGSPKGIPLECGAYGNKANEGIKLRLVSPRGLEFALKCSGQEVGERFDLLVFKGPKVLAEIPGVLAKGSDCDSSLASQAWLKDINGDKEMDLITRSKSQRIDGDCEGSGSNKIISQQDLLKVYFWKGETLSREPLSENQEKKYKAAYDFKF